MPLNIVFSRPKNWSRLNPITKALFESVFRVRLLFFRSESLRGNWDSNTRHKKNNDSMTLLNPSKAWERSENCSNIQRCFAPESFHRGSTVKPS